MNIVLCIIILILFTYLYFLKKQIRNINRQIKECDESNSKKKIDIQLMDKDIENLCVSINKRVDMSLEDEIQIKNLERELKQGISNISHDIRTPLTSILGYLQIVLKKDEIDLETKKQLETTKERALILRDILEKFHELSVVQSVEYKLENDKVNINNVLYEVLASFYDEFNKNKITPEINIEEENLLVVGNKVAINRVIENLFSNIIKYSKGEESIKLYKENKKVNLIVSNRVEGLYEEDVKLFFDRFYKQDISRKSSDSSGLGLCISKTLMEHMDAEIWIELKNDKVFLVCVWNYVE